MLHRGALLRAALLFLPAQEFEIERGLVGFAALRRALRRRDLPLLRLRSGRWGGLSPLRLRRWRGLSPLRLRNRGRDRSPWCMHRLQFHRRGVPCPSCRCMEIPAFAIDATIEMIIPVLSRRRVAVRLSQAIRCRHRATADRKDHTDHAGRNRGNAENNTHRHGLHRRRGTWCERVQVRAPRPRTGSTQDRRNGARSIEMQMPARSAKARTVFARI